MENEPCGHGLGITEYCRQASVRVMLGVVGFADAELPKPRVEFAEPGHQITERRFGW